MAVGSSSGAGRPVDRAPRAPGADTAGRPWAGRAFEPSPWAGDDGRAPAAFLAAHGEFAAGRTGPVAVLDSLRDARLLAPLVAQPGEDDDLADLRHRHTAELALPTVAGPDGRRVLPMFSSADALSRWNPDARPVPAPARQAALGAAADGTELVVVDPGSPTLFGLRRGAVEALARGTAWVPSWTDDEVLDALHRAAAAEPGLEALRVGPGDPACTLTGAEVRVVLVLRSADAAPALVARLQERWSADAAVTARVDSISIGLATV